MRERTELLIDGMREARTKRGRWMALVTALAFLTGGNVFWELREIGMAVTEEDMCSLEAHEHSEECYDEDGNLICGKEEHTHTAACFSDENADVETAEIWEQTLPEREGLSRQEQVALIAESQLGYAESVNNFILGEDETQHGYTRYGAWYGNPYGEWNTMFTYFCLYYVDTNTKYARSISTETMGTGKIKTVVEAEVDGNGWLVFKGLEAGTYTITETQKHDSTYNAIDPFNVTITNDKDNATAPDLNSAHWKVMKESDEVTVIEEGAFTFSVINSKGTTLPSTGGIGTTIFYVVGGTLVAGAVVLLITKKRMSINDQK